MKRSVGSWQGISWLGASVLLLCLHCTGTHEGAHGEDAVVQETVPDTVATMDERLRLNHIQIKGTHNSYHIAPPFSNVEPQWDYTHAPLDVQLAEQQVRHFELDLHWTPGEPYRVYHLPLLDEESTCDLFTECLAVLAAWSDANPSHVPLAVTLELKSQPMPGENASPYDQIFDEILAIWPRERIITPAEVQANHPTLNAAVRADAWPTLAASRGRILFSLQWQSRVSEHERLFLAAYPNLDGSLTFLRTDTDDVSLALPYAAVVEVGNSLDNEERVADLVLQGFLVRTHADTLAPDRRAGNPERAAAGLRGGAHWIATDFPAPDEEEFFFGLPGDVPARCNPVSAPPDCRMDPLRD